MADLLDQLAEDLARDALYQERISGDDGVVDAIAKSLADTSTTFSETFLTAIRYYRAEARARTLLPDVERDQTLSLPAPKAKPAASRPAPAEQDEPVEESSPQPAAPKAAQPDLDEDEIPYAEAEVVDDEPTTKPSGSGTFAGTGRLVPKPKISPEDADNPAVEPEITGPKKSGR